MTWYSGGTVFTLFGEPVPIFAGGEGLCLAGDRKINRETVKLRRFRSGDEFAVSDVICTTLAISNRKNYSPGFIEENIRSHSPAVIAAKAEELHFYVAMDGETIIGCGGITGYWGSTEESYLTSIFVLPNYQGKSVGRKIMESLEADEYFRRAWRTEVGWSLAGYLLF